MPVTYTIIFPHQLFEQHPALQKGQPVVLVEEWLFFKIFAFHQQKLVLHRASMKAYAAQLANKGYEVRYIDATDPKSDCRLLLAALAKAGVSCLELVYVADNWLEKRLTEAAQTQQLQLKWHNSPGFLNTREELTQLLGQKKKYFQTDFYIAQRKKRKLLLTSEGKAMGDKWTFDTENRAKFPKNGVLPEYHLPKTTPFVEEAITYVKKHFPENPGKPGNPFNLGYAHFYPTNTTEANQWLEQFLEERFALFGTYEDAIVANAPILFHSMLTPMLNIGLLTPQQVLDKALNAAGRNNIPLNALEGFIRQIIGWREFIHGVYGMAGSQQRTTNYWGFTRKIPHSFYTGNTGILPIDNVIRKVLQSGYAHHIERLMILGNFMLLCEFHPDEVYQWFMEMFVDAYDWVMVPNVYGMTQFADGGLMTTKPYISGSNYLMKMSDYSKGNWQEIWDALFWRFMHVHRGFFLQNPRLGMLIKTFDKMPEAKRQQHLEKAAQYLQSLT